MSDITKDHIVYTPATQWALDAAKRLDLKITSGYRDPAHNASTPGASPTSYHMSGQAYDIAGSHSAMDELAKEAKASGQFKEVLWQVPNHYDHVHLAWLATGQTTPPANTGGTTTTPTSTTGYIQTGGWMLLGVALVLTGVYVAVNPLSGLTSTLSKVGRLK